MLSHTPDPLSAEHARLSSAACGITSIASGANQGEHCAARDKQHPASVGQVSTARAHLRDDRGARIDIRNIGLGWRAKFAETSLARIEVRDELRARASRQ
jgi:hypothetical protein